MKKRIVIVGGGTSGWMSANILAYTFQHHPFEIVLLESADIPTVGVGEGSTPALKVFFDSLGILESEWMPKCDATYKCGITFSGWSTKPGFESYFHPFASALDSRSLGRFISNVQTRLQGKPAPAHPNHYFLAARLAERHLAPIPNDNFPFEVSYGYHFDAGLLGKFLRDKAIARGVRHVIGTVAEIKQNDLGEIDSVATEDQQRFAADLFVDCSGFRSLLSQQTLQVPFISYADALFNDSAVALPSPQGQTIASQTISAALRFGWAWRIPLRSREGNGYVYSSKYCTADEAEFELRRHLGLLDSDVSARHLKMKVGRVEKSWHNNVLAVGLSQGFIEPLEATALLLIQQTVSLFAHYYIQGHFSNQHAAEFNRSINQQFDRTRDYIYTHYQTNSRTDSAYWIDNRENKSAMGDSLARLFRCWVRGEDLEQEIRSQKIERFYPVSSWYCIMAGMGMMPDLISGATGDGSLDRIQDVREYVRRCALNFRDHAEVLHHPEIPSHDNLTFLQHPS